MTVGIDAIAIAIARLSLPVSLLAAARNIDPEKLEKGLGLKAMTLPDVHQDVVVFAANALTKLFSENSIHPNEVSRIYVGTESGIDSAKPVGSYLLPLLEQQYGTGSCGHIDTVDFMFACIAGVDALETCLDYIRLNPEKKAVVITTDIAKYDLGSPGEYTQGAGALAMLLTANPRILSFSREIAVSSKGVHDFFKPHRIVTKPELTGLAGNEPWQGVLESEVHIHKDQPVFDGQYSNHCYAERTKEAYFSYKKNRYSQTPLHDRWDAIVMHLPYAYQGRRMFTEIYALDSENRPTENNNAANDKRPDLKEIAKSDGYLGLVSKKLAPAERASSHIGNLYTGSIFMALASALAVNAEYENDLTGKTVGFLAYGSGSKAKVFEGVVQPGWQEGVTKTALFQQLAKSVTVDFETYLRLHKKEQTESVVPASGEWVLSQIEKEKPNLLGARYYRWVSAENPQ